MVSYECELRNWGIVTRSKNQDELFINAGGELKHAKKKKKLKRERLTVKKLQIINIIEEPMM